MSSIAARIRGGKPAVDIGGASIGAGSDGGGAFVHDITTSARKRCRIGASYIAGDAHARHRRGMRAVVIVVLLCASCDPCPQPNAGAAEPVFIPQCMPDEQGFAEADVIAIPLYEPPDGCFVR